MSHVASVKAYVVDLDALEKVCDDLGLELVRDAHSYKWYGRWVNDYRGAQAAVDNGHDPKTFGKCVHKIRRKDGQGYEIGLVNRLDGEAGFEMVYDNWGAGGTAIEALAGERLQTLKKALSVEVTTRIMRRQGCRVLQTVDVKTGKLKIQGIR